MKNRQYFPFDYYVRSVTASLLALLIVGATLWSIMTSHHPNELLIGWTGIVVGVYFGFHIGTSGPEEKSHTDQKANGNNSTA